jgi:hypothetical protein
MVNDAMPNNQAHTPTMGAIKDATPDMGAVKNPTPLAKGGPMQPGKPYLVGEEGWELAFGREDGSMFVLPHDVSKQVLPMLPKGGVKPRAQGGPMELIEPLSDGQGEVAFRGFDMGPGRRGFATTVTGQGADATAPVGPSMILDPSARYQLDPTAPGMPMLPDVVSGPFAEPGLPAPDMRAMQSNISERVETLPGRGATQMVRSRYPGMTFNDRAVQSMVDYGDALPGETVADFQAKERQYNQALRDPFIGSTKENLSFEEMQQRVAMRGMMFGDDFRDRQARNQTQADLAARAARAPLGTPVLPPTAPGGLPMVPGMERNIERFLRTPQGAMFALEQGTEDARMERRIQAAATAIPVRDQQTGEVRGYVSGTGASLPSPGMDGGRKIRRQQMVEGQMYNFFDDGTAEPVNIATAGSDKIQAWDTGNARMVELPADTDVTKLPPGLTLLPRTGTAPAAKTDTAKTDAAKPTATGAKSRVKALMDRRAQPAAAAS